ncbi:hypothetical protein, partial [uncultured Deinococcus sp.]|uniref:hypothetical protein n=1 Tax=uncultured Deinococcus sp. TaxID=158789 RepID=UPI0025E38457
PTPAAGFTLAVSADKLPVITGTSGTLTVTVARQSGFTDAVTVTLDGLPTGATAPTVTIPDGQTSATVTVSAAASAPHSQPTAVTVMGTAGTQHASKTVTVTVRGPAGSLDTTFGAGGISRNPIGQAEDYGYAAALQPDGKLILVGSVKGPTFEDFGVVRFTRDGALDPTFGTGGKVVIDFAGDRETARAVAVQRDGKIVVAGGTRVPGDGERFALLRLNANGSVDTSFGSGGTLTTAFPGSDGDRADALIIQPDGKIVVGGQASFSTSTTGVDFALARYLPSGALDTSFGTGGRVTTPVSSNAGSDKIFALALQGDRIVAAGGDVFQLTRYTAAGVLDTSFGTGGKVEKVFPSSSGATSVVVDAEKRLVVGGQDQMNTAVVRLNENGALDTRFGSGGRTVLKLNPSNWNVTTGVAVQSDGKIVTGGWVYEGNTSNDNFAVTRLTASGQVDTAFGTNGTTVTKGGANTRSTARAALLQPDDRIPATRIVLAGDSDYDFTLTRYWP